MYLYNNNVKLQWWSL